MEMYPQSALSYNEDTNELEITAPVKIGDISGGNYLQIEQDGTAQANNDATAWEDIQSSLIGKRLSSTSGKVDYNYDENTITFQPGGSMGTANDRVAWNIQMPHATKTDSTLRPHIHFEQVSSDKIEFSARYRIQVNGQAKTTAWTTITCDTDNNTLYTYVAGTLNQIVIFDAIDLTDAGLSAVVEFQMVRDDATADDIEVTFVDSHYERDTAGSRTEYSK